MRGEQKKVTQKEMDRLKHLGIIWKGLTSVTVKNIPTHEIIPPVYFCVQNSVKNIPGVCFCIRQYIMGNMYDML